MGWFVPEQKSTKEERFEMRTLYRPILWPQPPASLVNAEILQKDAKCGEGSHLFMHNRSDLKKLKTHGSSPHFACSLVDSAEGRDGAVLKSEIIAAYRMIIDNMGLIWYHEHDIFPVRGNAFQCFDFTLM